MEHDISLGFLLRILKKAWWKMAIVFLAALLVVSLLASLAITQRYSSSIECYVVNTNTSYDYTSTSLLGAASYLINDYVSILKSDEVLNQVQAKLEEQGFKNVTVSRLRGMIGHSAKENTSVFTITLTDSNQALVTATARVIAELAPTAITEIAKSNSQTHRVYAGNIYAVIEYYNQIAQKEAGEEAENIGLSVTENEIANLLESEQLGITIRQDCIAVLTAPKEAAPVSRGILSYGMLGGIAAAAVAYLFFLLRHLLEQNISSEDDVKKLVNRPLIGAIPHWDIPQAKK